MITEKLVEITGTADGFTYLPHTYMLDEDGKLVAFKESGGAVKVFSKPLMFDRRGRKFKKLKV